MRFSADVCIFTKTGQVNLVGRTQQKKQIVQYYTANTAHFVAVYGRRRVGKTYLIKEHFNNQFTFYCTGLIKGNKTQQLHNFIASLKVQLQYEDDTVITTWYDAFALLIKALKRIKKTDKKLVLFMDELPWMDTKGADFLLGLDFFWNSCASTQKNILLIVCGSSTSWIINNLFSDTGGLYNRVTGKIKLEPFTLQECALFFAAKGCRYSPIQCIEAYMVFGGIPYYLDQFVKELSPVQNINELCFGKTAFLKTEYILLFKSLFAKYDVYLKVVDAICSKNKGLTRAEIAQKTGLSNGGSLTAILQDLEHSNFIKKYTSFNKKTKGSLFQMIDSFCLFYNNLNSKTNEAQYWINNYNSPTYNNWAGYAFEIVCLNHVAQIKKALGIQGMLSNTYSWQNEAAQIDLVLDRADNIINLFEIKYTQAPYVITKKYDAVLRTKIQQFADTSASKKAIWPVCISPYGLSKNGYSHFFTHDFTMEILFVSSE